MIMSRFFLLYLPFLSCLPPIASAEQSHYLKEILLGRCYFEPPTKKAVASQEICPSLVGSIMNLIESHLDADIYTADFETYLQEADFSSPPDKAVFYLHFFGNNAPSSFSLPLGFVIPETTPGGALLSYLTFCGVDQCENCSIEKSNAYWTFWEAGTCVSVRLECQMMNSYNPLTHLCVSNVTYAKFASQVQGQVHMIVDGPQRDVQFLQRSALSNLDPDAISSITIYGDCAGLLMGALKQRVGMADKVTCKNDIAEFYLDLFMGRDQLQPDQSGREHAAFWVRNIVLFLFLLFLFVFGLNCMTPDNRHGDKTCCHFQAVRDCYKSVLDAMHDFWGKCDGDDNGGTTEHSSLITNGRNQQVDYVVDEFGCRIPIRRQKFAQ